MHAPDSRRYRAVGTGFLFVIFCGLAYGQKPVVYPGGVVNGASFAKEGQPSSGVAQGSIASIFGENLASTTASAQSLPLPKTLAGTSVTINGLPARLFYVSPGQLNVQVPAAAAGSEMFSIGQRSVPLVVVSAAGRSEPVMVEIAGRAPGIFTLSATGCGAPVLFNYHPDGTMSLNSPVDSISPGGGMIAYGTGFGYAPNQPPDGEPSPFNPLAQTPSRAGVWINGRDADVVFTGRTPGLVGLDQVNLLVPADMAEGCSLPMAISLYSRSQPLPVSVRKGGGQCVNPPPDSLGTIHWEKVILTSGIDQPPPSETVQIDFTSSIGKRAPAPSRPVCGHGWPIVPGPLCPGFAGTALDETALDAGTLTLQVAAQRSLSVAPQTVDGKLVYRVDLPPGSIQEGTLRVVGSGGGVGPFETSVKLPPPIQITSPFPPGTKIREQSLTVNWTGGDADSLVRMRLTSRFPAEQFESWCEAEAAAADGKVTLGTVDCSFLGRSQQCLPVSLGPDMELVITVMPKDPQAGQFSAGGLTLGGRHTWAYRYRFGKLTNQ